MSQLSPSEIENYRVEGFVVFVFLFAYYIDLLYLLEYLVGLKKSE